MKLIYLIPILLLITCSSTNKEVNGSELYSGKLLYTAGLDYNQPNFDPSKLRYLMLHDIETGITKRLTNAKHRDDNPIFLSDDEILFESKRPCSGYATDDCPSKLFKMSIESGRIEEFSIAISGTIDSLKTEIGKDDIYQSPVIQELNLVENAEPQFKRPRLNHNRDLLAFTLSIFTNSYLVVYDLSIDSVIYTVDSNLLGMSYYWSPNKNSLARLLGTLTGSDRSIKIINFDDNSSTTVQLPSGLNQFSGWSSEGDRLLLSKSSTMNSRYTYESYFYHIDEEVITNITNEKKWSVEDWIYVTKDNHFLVQRYDSNNKLDLWFIDSTGSEIERITNNSYRKKVTDIQLKKP